MNAKEFIKEKVQNEWNGKVYLGFYEDEEIDVFDMMELYAESKAENLPISHVRERFYLRIKIEWIHLVFRFKYPETTTEPITWLSNYNVYLRKCQEIRKRLNAL
jgi:hypothetical protein